MEVQFGKTVNLSQAASLIKNNPDLTFLLQGEPGIGKSSILESIAEDLGYEHAYIDVPNMDLGDIAMPVIDHATRTTKYYPNARFKIHGREIDVNNPSSTHNPNHKPKPVVIMLDEFTKGPDPVKNMLHPMFEKKNRRLGSESLLPQDIVFLTGNQSADGVGDSMKAHTRSRIVPVTVRKPDADEWVAWGINHDIAPEVLAFVSRYPHVMASYMDESQKDNPYIFHPKRAQQSFICPRSLHTASSIVKNRKHYDSDSLIAALTGAIGEAGARDLQAFIEFADQLPTWEATVTQPKVAPVPTSPGACAVVVFGAISRVTEKTIAPFMEYLERFETEWQAVFAVQIAKTASKQSIAFGCNKFANWLAANQDLL